jgi:hypothetical protein
MKHSAMKKLCIVLTVVIISFECSAALEFTIDNYSLSHYPGTLEGLSLGRTSYLLPHNTAYSFELEKGESITIPLFTIGTDENSVQTDDTYHQPISTHFNITQSGTQFSATVTGESYAIMSTDNGVISWSDPVDVSFGLNGLGKLRFDLNNITFPTPGEGTINGTITLMEVPEPTSISLLAFGTLTILKRRKR